jgi:hypothetical protein
VGRAGARPVSHRTLPASAPRPGTAAHRTRPTRRGATPTVAAAAPTLLPITGRGPATAPAHARPSMYRNDREPRPAPRARELAPDELEVLARALYEDRWCLPPPRPLSEAEMEGLAEELYGMQGPRPGGKSADADGYFESFQPLSPARLPGGARCHAAPLAPAGSPEKQDVLAERRRRGEAMGHAGDDGATPARGPVPLAVGLGYLRLLGAIGRPSAEAYELAHELMGKVGGEYGVEHPTRKGA